MICCKCNKEMVEKETVFQYLGREMTYPVLRCPQCGQAYVPEDLVKTKIHEVETMLEEK